LLQQFANSYPAPGQPFPHAVSSISGGVVNTTFSYDANGNLTAGNGLAITYAAFNKPETITNSLGRIFETENRFPLFLKMLRRRQYHRLCPR
jgi:hypothetical protein